MPFARIVLRYGKVLFHVFFLLFIVLMWFISNRNEQKRDLLAQLHVVHEVYLRTNASGIVHGTDSSCLVLY